MNEIDQLQVEVNRLEKELVDAREKLREAVITAAGFSEGEVVEARKKYARNTEWRPAIIRRIYVDWKTHCRYTVSFAKKDGDWSQVVVDYAEVRKPQ